MNFKQYIESEQHELYHVTHTSSVPKIIKKGIIPLQTSNWTRAGERYGEGQVFAFSNFMDAMHWASKMDWDFNKKMGSGKISIITFKDEKPWEVDESDPLSQLGKKSEWLKRHGSIAPENIIKIQPFTPAMAKILVKLI